MSFVYGRRSNIPLAHRAMDKGVLLDWLKHCEEQGDAWPTDQEIMDRFGLVSIDRARTLLADLADAGLIKLSFRDGGRAITIRCSKPPVGPPPAANPYPDTDPYDQPRPSVDRRAQLKGFTIYLTPEKHAALKEMSARQGRTMSDILIDSIALPELESDPDFNEVAA